MPESSTFGLPTFEGSIHSDLDSQTQQFMQLSDV